MSASAIAAWKCDTCKVESGSVTSRSDSEEQSSLMELMKTMQREMASNHLENKESFTILNKSVSTINETLISIQQRTTTLESDYATLKANFESVSKTNDILLTQVSNLQCSLEDLQQYTRCANIEIKGVPVTAGEDVKCIVEAVAAALGVNYVPGDVSTAHRLRAPRDRASHPGIVVQFVSRNTRAAWLEAARKKRIRTTDLAATLQPGPVYVNEHLTGLNKALLGRAKSFVHKGNLLSAWCRNGVVMVRKSAGSPPQRVRTLAEVETVAGATREGSPGAEGHEHRHDQRPMN